MKVGQQHVHLRKRKARRNEDLGFALRLAGGRPGLQAAHRRRAHRHHAAAARFAIGKRLLGGQRHLVPLAVHAVLGQVLGFDRLEGAGAHMQGDVGGVHAPRLQVGQQGLVKMQRRGGRGHGTGGFGKHGLVALGVLRRVRVCALLLALNIGRQRHVPMALHQGVGVIAGVVGQHKTKQRPVGIGPAPEQGGAEAVGRAGGGVQGDGRPDLGLFAHPHVRGHLVAAQHALNEQLQLAAGGLFAKQARFEHAGVVHDQQIAGAQQAAQIAKNPVRGWTVRGVQQPGAAALGRWLLGDQMRRQVKIKIAEGVGRRHGA